MVLGLSMGFVVGCRPNSQATHLPSCSSFFLQLHLTDLDLSPSCLFLLCKISSLSAQSRPGFLGGVGGFLLLRFWWGSPQFQQFGEGLEGCMLDLHFRQLCEGLGICVLVLQMRVCWGSVGDGRIRGSFLGPVLRDPRNFAVIWVARGDLLQNGGVRLSCIHRRSYADLCFFAFCCMLLFRRCMLAAGLDSAMGLL